MSRLARPHRHPSSEWAGSWPAARLSPGCRNRRGAAFLIALPQPPPSLSPAAPGPAGPGSSGALAAARGKSALWLPTAARLQEKARISWPGVSPSRLLPAAESLGAQGWDVPNRFWDLQGARKEEAAGSGHFCWQCQNLPLCSILPINKPPARAEPLASTEMFLPFGARGVSPTMGHNGQLGGLV